MIMRKTALVLLSERRLQEEKAFLSIGNLSRSLYRLLGREAEGAGRAYRERGLSFHGRRRESGRAGFPSPFGGFTDKI